MRVCVRVSLVRPQTHVVLDAGVVLVLVRHFTRAISTSERAWGAQEQTPPHLTHSLDRSSTRRLSGSSHLVSFGTLVSQGAARFGKEGRE